jgi:hypothetical protein
MAGNKVEVDTPEWGRITIENAASEDTLRSLLKVMEDANGDKKTDPSVKAEETQRKKNTKALKDQTSEIEENIKAAKKEQESQKTSTGFFKKQFEKLPMWVQGSLGETFKVFGSMAAASLNQFAGMLANYDEMAAQPIKAGADMVKFAIDMIHQVASLGTSILFSGLQGAAAVFSLFVPGLVGALQSMEGFAQDILDMVQSAASFVNDVLEKEFQKRVDTLNMYAANFIGLAGGLSDVASLAGSAALPIKMFGEAVGKARPFMTEMGLAGGTAAKLLSKVMGSMASEVGRGGRALRDELFAMGISFADQGAMAGQYLARMRSLGVDIKNVPMAQLAQGTAEYAKHLRVLSDLTGQDASALMESARAEAQRGALMTTLTANQARAFQDSFAIFSTLPQQQGAKLQTALAQLLAGGVVTDPIIAGNAIVMDMLKTTAQQVSTGNIDMIQQAQTNLAMAATDYRAAGESVTDFATLMSPNTGAVAQGMSQFANALRQYRVEPGMATASLQQTESMAQASGAYVGLTETMIGFQMTMEGITGSVLPVYTEMMVSATNMTMAVTKAGVKYLQAMFDAGADLGKQIGAATNLVADLTGAPTTITGAVAKVVGSVDEGLGRITSGILDNFTDISVADILESDGKGTPQVQNETITEMYKKTASAKGNILKGPTTGYPALLHGTEAVVPLPDGRAIPVEMKQQPTSSMESTNASAVALLSASVDAQTAKMTELVSLMQRNNNLTSGILQASM